MEHKLLTLAKEIEDYIKSDLPGPYSGQTIDAAAVEHLTRVTCQQAVVLLRSAHALLTWRSR